MVAGHLREKRGYFHIVLSYTDENGKRQTPSKTTGLPVKGNKKRAEAMLMEARQSKELELKKLQEEKEAKEKEKNGTSRSSWNKDITGDTKFTENEEETYEFGISGDFEGEE